jgi:hypothetical protein
VAGFALFKIRTFSFAVFRTGFMLMRCKVSDSSRHSNKNSRKLVNSPLSYPNIHIDTLFAPKT